MGRRCAVLNCASDSARPEDFGVSFHKIPLQASVRENWFTLCKISEDKKESKIIYVCSRHFLRADFCDFKGRKYMLRQGVLPSVFPWDKSKLEAIKLEKDSDRKSLEKLIKQEVDTENTDSSSSNNEIQPEIKDEITVEYNDLIDVKLETETIDFSSNTPLEALDFNNQWTYATILEVDEGENEVLIHFDKYSNKYDEWISMDSARIRPLPKCNEDLEVENMKDESQVTFKPGERCMAFWDDTNKFPATVTQLLEDGTCEVQFDDGYVKNLALDRLIKTEGAHLQSSPLFDPVKSTKQERRDKKRRLNVVELFAKRQKLESCEGRSRHPSPAKGKTSESGLTIERDISSSMENRKKNTQYNDDPWLPRWYNGLPVGTPSTLTLNEGVKKTVIVPDPNLPEGWTKHVLKKTSGLSAGKWEAIIVSPDNKKFRGKGDIKHYLEETKLFPYDEKMFVFNLYQRSQKRRKSAVDSRRSIESKAAGTPPPVLTAPSSPLVSMGDSEQIAEQPEDEANQNLLKIPMVDGGYQCPIEGCRKQFRRENLAQMHVKHYHPEYTKFLDSTPNVADLAYARTVGESFDKSPATPKPVMAKPAKTSTPKMLPKSIQSPSHESEATLSLTPLFKNANKDSEIIKLLNTKSTYEMENETCSPTSIGTEETLKDLLTRPLDKSVDLLNKPGYAKQGIKTLLPIARQSLENKDSSEPQKKTKQKRKKSSLTEQPDGGSKIKFPVEEATSLVPVTLPGSVPPPEQPSVIMEGGQLIKIVRMKQEEIINCTCRFAEEDGLMIQCEVCLCWQHAYCNNIERESQVPDKYICYICQNPYRQRTSRKYLHDQEWLKQGALPVASYHSKDEEALQKRFEKLKQAHDISGGLVELEQFFDTLTVKLKIAEAKNHPKLYLWSKPWEKLPLPEKQEMENDEKIKMEPLEELIKDENVKTENQADNMLLMMFKDKDLQAANDNSFPQPEAAIETADCRLNLLEHVQHSQNLIMERLDNFEKQIEHLEEYCSIEKDENYPSTRHTLSMLLKDLEKLQDLSQCTSL